MNHKVNNITKLYEDAARLYNGYVTGSGDSSAGAILENLKSGIETLKNSWKGQDAGIQINSVIKVYNAMVEVRNALAQLAEDSAAVAVNYRAIQRANGATSLEELGTLPVDTAMTKMPEYSDNTEAINITAEAVNAKSKLDAAASNLGAFKSGVESLCNDITSNWTEGAGRQNAETAFSGFLAAVGTYESIISEVSQNITTALNNYSM